MNDCDKRLEAMENLLNKIFNILNGRDGVGGLVTKVALQEQRIEDIPSPTTLKFYASVGGGVIMVLALLGTAIVQLFTDS